MKILLVLFFIKSDALLTESERFEACAKLTCDNVDSQENSVCGIKKDGSGFRLRLFENECTLLKYGCEVGKGNEYGETNRYYCTLLHINLNSTITTRRASNDNANVFLEEYLKLQNNQLILNNRTCDEIDCEHTSAENETICGIQRDGFGFRLRKFPNECSLNNFNCKENTTFFKIDDIKCENLSIINNMNKIENTTVEDQVNGRKSVLMPFSNNNNIIVINSSMLELKENINETIDNFFASTHYFNYPLKEIVLDDQVLNATRRGRILNILKPLKIFQPWVNIPDNKSEDHYHKPTLASCFHKCPEECPDTYAPVCGVPGIIAREPSLMFRNHCFMDKAQCKMFWEDKSSTSLSSAYVESSFMFCLGDELNGLYRFLPLLKSLQHMGRLKMKGKFNYRIRNFRYFNKYLQRQPNFMG